MVLLLLLLTVVQSASVVIVVVAAFGLMHLMMMLLLWMMVAVVGHEGNVRVANGRQVGFKLAHQVKMLFLGISSGSSRLTAVAIVAILVLR